MAYMQNIEKQVLSTHIPKDTVSPLREILPRIHDTETRTEGSVCRDRGSPRRAPGLTCERTLPAEAHARRARTLGAWLQRIPEFCGVQVTKVQVG